MQARRRKKLVTLLDLCVSSLRRGHANLLCIVPILSDDRRSESKKHSNKKLVTLLDLCVSSLRRGHANLLCIVPILSDDRRSESKKRSSKKLSRFVRVILAQEPRYRIIESKLATSPPLKVLLTKAGDATDFWHLCKLAQQDVL